MPTRSGYEPGQFCWVDLAARDQARATAFYRGLFGWVDDIQGGGDHGYAIFRLDGDEVAGIGELSPSMKEGGVPPVWSSYIWVANADEAVGRIQAEGGLLTVPVTEIPGAGRMAFFQDPTGGHAAIWEPGRHRGASRVDEPGCWCWNELATRDLAGAERFYGAVFGWEFHDNPAAPSRYSVIRNAGRDNGGILLMNEDWGDMPPHWSVYFAVEDADAAVGRIGDLGGKVEFGPFDTPAGRVLVAADVEGTHFYAIELRGEG